MKWKDHYPQPPHVKPGEPGRDEYVCRLLEITRHFARDYAFKLSLKAKGYATFDEIHEEVNYGLAIAAMKYEGVEKAGAKFLTYAYWYAYEHAQCRFLRAQSAGWIAYKKDGVFTRRQRMGYLCDKRDDDVSSWEHMSRKWGDYTVQLCAWDLPPSDSSDRFWIEVRKVLCLREFQILSMAMRDGMNNAEIGRKLGNLSRERVRGIIAVAMSRLKKRPDILGKLLRLCKESNEETEATWVGTGRTKLK